MSNLKEMFLSLTWFQHNVNNMSYTITPFRFLNIR